MLQPAEISANLRGASEMASQSTRAWLAEQDLGGFDELDPAAVAAAAAAAPPADADNFGMPEDGYNYGQHLRQMGGGTFIERQRAAGGGSAAGGSVAGVSVTRSAVSGMSRMTRASRASIKSSLQLRDVAEEEVFGATEDEELAVGVGGALNAEDAQAQNDEARAQLDDDLWAALHDDDDGGGDDDATLLNDDFVIEADAERQVELVAYPSRASRPAASAAAAAGDDESFTVGGGGGGGGGGWEEDALVALQRQIDELNTQRDGLRRAAEGAAAAAIAECDARIDELLAERAETLDARARAAADHRAVARPGAAAAGAAAGGAAAGGGAPPKKKNPFADLFGDIDEDDEDAEFFAAGSDDDDDDDDDSWGGDGGDGGYDPAASGRAERLLDKRFAQLMQEYDDDEIGELDQDDPSVLGDAPIEVRAPPPAPDPRARATRARWPPAAARPPGVTRTITTQPTAGLRSNPNES